MTGSATIFRINATSRSAPDRCSTSIKELSNSPFEAFLVQKLVQELLLHADETGIQINKTLHWLHCLCNERWTLLRPHTKRGGDAILAMGVLQHFKGRLG